MSIKDQCSATALITTHNHKHTRLHRSYITALLAYQLKVQKLFETKLLSPQHHLYMSLLNDYQKPVNGSALVYQVDML